MRISLKILCILSLTLLSTQCKDNDINFYPEAIIITDFDGNQYTTITLGNQTWMLENLKTTTFNDGTPITKWTSENDWYNINTPTTYYQWADTSDLNNVYNEELPFGFFGAMYNNFTISSGKLAPKGWRIPTIEDFKILEAYLSTNGFKGNEATVLKSTEGWLGKGNNGTDNIGFNSLPNGYVSAFGTATAAQTICTWATSQVNTKNQTRAVINLFDKPTILYSENGFQLGAAVRCIKN